MNESVIQSAIRKALAPHRDLVLWRLSQGTQTRDGRVVATHGLVPGAADLIGILAPSGRWFALEIKTPRGRLRPEQERWLALVRSYGGFAAVARSPEEALAALERARGGASE